MEKDPELVEEQEVSKTLELAIVPNMVAEQGQWDQQRGGSVEQDLPKVVEGYGVQKMVDRPGKKDASPGRTRSETAVHTRAAPPKQADAEKQDPEQDGKDPGLVAEKEDQDRQLVVEQQEPGPELVAEQEEQDPVLANQDVPKTVEVQRVPKMGEEHGERGQESVESMEPDLPKMVEEPDLQKMVGRRAEKGPEQDEECQGKASAKASDAKAADTKA